MATDGHGATLTFSTSAFSANLLSLDGPSRSREAIDSSHMGTSTNMTYIPASLSDGGELSVEFEFDSSLTPPIDAVAETITIAWSDGGSDSFEGFMTAYSPSAAIGERMTASATIKISGAIT